MIHDCNGYRELAYFFGIEHAWKVYASGRLAFSRPDLSKLSSKIDAYSDSQKVIDACPNLFYYPLNTGKEVIKKYMSSNHSEVAAA